jgi:hypothetical protein
LRLVQTYPVPNHLSIFARSFPNPISSFNAVYSSGGSIDPNTGRIINPVDKQTTDKHCHHFATVSGL